MQFVLWIYFAIGVAPWAMFCAALLITRSRLLRMYGESPALPDPPPSVAIITPAKDEAEHIESCVRGLIQQDYPHFAVLVINDRSTDGTGEILDRIASERQSGALAPGLSVRHINTLPAGWLGKCHALYEGTRDLSVDWLLFVDSDVTIEPDALRRTIAIACARGYDAVSLLPRLDARSFIERLMIPICGTAWGIMFVMHWTNDDHRREFAVANGQFLLVRRAAYDQVDGHRAVRQQIVEDVELMRLLKAAGHRCRIFAAPHLVATRMHATLAELRSGWGRIFAGTACFRRAPMLAAMAFVIASGLSVYPMLVWAIDRGVGEGDWRLMSLAATHWALMTGFLAYAYRAVRVSPWISLLPIVSFPLLLGLLWRGVQRCSDRRFDWRGTTVELEHRG